MNNIKLHETDTGSIGVQIAALHARITLLNSKLHPNDKHSYFGVIKMVSQMRKLIDHCKKKASGSV